MLLAFNANAVTGVGEYRFGPDTAENSACEFAEEKAKEDALIKFNGEYVDATIQEVCSSEDCKFNRQTYNKIEGNIKSISSVKKFIKTEQGYKTCIVTVNADVERFKNKIEFLIDGKFDLKNGEFVEFIGTSNQFGAVYMFNYYDGKYVKVLQQKVATKWQKFMLPSEAYRIKAQVPSEQMQSKELLLFLFVTNNMSMKDSYTDAELKSVISQIPAHERKVITRHINILR
jgi:hypothetical protein